MKRIFSACVNSWRGFLWVARSEAAFRQEIAVLVLAFPAALFVAHELFLRLALIGVVLFVLIVELLNTVVEKLCDRLTTDHDVQIGRVKDIGSAAVGLSIRLAAAVWIAAALRALHWLQQF